MFEALIGAVIGALAVASVALLVEVYRTRAQLGDEQLARDRAEERARRAEAMTATMAGFREELVIVHETVGALVRASAPAASLGGGGGDTGVCFVYARSIRINELD